MALNNWNNLKYWDFTSFLLLCFLFFWNNKGCHCVILEKTVSACNGRCAKVSLTCPVEHKIAIREALFGVHPLGPVCPVTTDCDRAQSDICCEKTPSTDCMVPYPVDRLEPLHKGCSGKLSCDVNIVGNQDLATVCPATGPPGQHNTTYTILDYVCVNDTFTADFCSEEIITVSGRTVFALFDSKTASSWKGEKLCTCVAHSTTWPIENPISVFVVDIRLNQAKSAQCSDSMVSISAGKTIKDINCKSVHDPGFPYPFVSVLNSTTVALAQLVLKDTTPDYVWIGFEASLDEEIRVSCGVHGWSKHALLEEPQPKDKGSGLSLSNDSLSGKTDLPIAAIIGGFIGGVLLTAIVAAIILLAIRKKKQKVIVDPDLLEPYATIESCNEARSRKEPRGSIDHDEMMVFEAPSANYAPPWDVKGHVTETNSDEYANDSAYVDATEVRKKKKVDQQKSRELAPKVQKLPKPSDAVYVDASDVRKKKLENKMSSMAPEASHPPRRQNAIDRKKANEYDQLNNYQGRKCPTPPGYSHLKREYMEIEVSNGSDKPVETVEDSIYENGTSLHHEHELQSSQRIKDSDGGSDSSCIGNSPNYELAKPIDRKS